MLDIQVDAASAISAKEQASARKHCYHSNMSASIKQEFGAVISFQGISASNTTPSLHLLQIAFSCFHSICGIFNLKNCSIRRECRGRQVIAGASGAHGAGQLDHGRLLA